MKNGKHQKPKNPRPSKLLIPFFAVLAVLTVVAFVIPLRPTRSYTERRDLAKLPAFSLQALLDGSYTDGVSTWFSDTFPGREQWISASARLEELHGISDITIYGDIPISDEVPVVPTPQPTAAPTPTPQPTPTPVPTPTPEPTPEPTPVPVEVVAPPVESVEKWGGVMVDDEAEVVFGTVLQIGDAAYGYFGFSQYGCESYAAVISEFADAMAEKGVDTYSMLIPTSVGVLVSSEYMEKVKCADQGAAITYTLSCMGENVKKVNIFNNLVAHNDEYIYFRTDHHWTALGAYYAYESFCAASGKTAAPLESFTELDQGSYKGSFFYSCNQSSRLKVDQVMAYDPPGDLEVIITQANDNSFPWTVITDMSKSSESAKYMAFLAGDYPLVTITNNDLPDAPVCVIVKDSFGNPFVPFMTQNYSKIYVIDYRQYTKMKLNAFVDAYGVDEVIFAQSLAMAESEGTIGLTRSLCK